MMQSTKLSGGMVLFIALTGVIGTVAGADTTLDRECKLPKASFAPHPSIPIGAYRDYALPANAHRLESGAVLAATVLARCNDFQKINAESAHTVVRMPFGWLSDDDGKKTSFFTPDRRVRIIMHFIESDQTDPTAENWQTFGKQIESQLAGQKYSRLEKFILPGGDFALKVTAIATNTGSYNSMLMVVTRNPLNAHHPSSVSLTAPADIFDKYVGLMGLILRDRQINWSAGGKFENLLDQMKDSEIFSVAAQDAVQALVKGEPEKFVRMLSSNSIKTNGREAINRFITDSLIPFFSDFSVAATDLKVVRPARDAYGNEGFSFHFEFLTKSGKKKSYQIAVVKEEGRLVIANIHADAPRDASGR